MAARKIIIDTDPGQDDAVAILLALASPELEVLGLSVVAGNVPLDLTVTAARKVVELAERRDVGVYAGCGRPLARSLVTAEHVHGETGIDGYPFPEPTVAVQDEHAVDFIIRTVREHPPGEVTLVILGPLTNVALAMHRAPDIVPRLKEIVAVMGSFGVGGNIAPLGEFNIYVDPEAAAKVVGSGARIVMVPMDITLQVLSTPERLAAIRSGGTRCAVAAADMLTFSETYDLEKYGWDGAPLYDPCAIAYLLSPESFGGRDINVEICLDGDVAYGMAVVDWWGVSDRPTNCHYLREVDPRVIYALLTERLAVLP